jgi:alkylation response protein AidB-like acyl-CoA dehydrogenase
MIDFSYTSEQLALREEIIAFAREAISPGADQRDQEQFFDRTIWRACGTIGLPGLLIPETYGGRGLDPVSTVIALEALGYGSTDSGMNFSLAAHLLACAVPIWIYGSEEQKQRLLPKLCNGEWIAANAMTEPTAGSDAFQMAASADRTATGYSLNGHKNYCSNGPVADIVVGYFNTDAEKGFFGGISAFILEKDQHNFQTSERKDKMGVRTCQMGEFLMEDTLVAEDCRLGKEGAGAMIFNHSMEWERICLGAVHIGSMERLLEQAVQFAKSRTSGGQSISKYQAVTHPLTELRIRMEAARLLCHRAAWKLQQGKKVAMDAAMVKIQLSETYRDFAIQLHQLYAGKAFRENSEIEKLVRDAMGATLYSGTTEVLRNLLARYMGLG